MRREAGYTIETIATRVGVRPDDIEAWELGKKVPDADQFFSLLGWLKCDVFDVTVHP